MSAFPDVSDARGSLGVKGDAEHEAVGRVERRGRGFYLDAARGNGTAVGFEMEELDGRFPEGQKSGCFESYTFPRARE